jgi:phenylacetate-coenzyme A ligase PaaK-like adenylate-forming protein
VVPLHLPISRIVEILNRFQPAILTTYPSVLETLVEERAAGRLRIRPVFVETSGETADAEAARRARTAFGCPVHDAYACSEFMFLAFGCPYGWLHVNGDWVILEPVDRDMRPTPPGEQSHTVLLTNLANHVQPLIRYDLGDSVEARADRCPCGIRLPAIRVAGRRDDVMHLADARGRRVAVAPLAIGSVVEGVPGVQRCQLVQHAPDGVRVRVEVRPGADGASVRRQALQALRRYLAHIGLDTVSVVDDPSLPRSNPRSGKFRQVIVEPAAEVPDSG